MTEVAGEVADGVIAHAFTTEKYLRETDVACAGKRLAKAGKSRSDFEISYPAFVVTGQTEEELREAEVATCKQDCFLRIHTGLYRPVLDSIGVGELQDELNRMSKQGRWDEMGELITPDILKSLHGRTLTPLLVRMKALRRYR